MSKLMKRKPSKLDEMQEQKLLHIEKNGCWLAFWMLLIAMAVQMMISGMGNFRGIAGEWIVFMCLALYLVIDCMRNGIWDRRMEPDAKTNFKVSLLASVITGIIFGIINYTNYHMVAGALATFVIIAGFIFVSVFVALSISAAIYKKRFKEMEEE